MTRQKMIDLLAKYRRPGSPMYEHHFQGLPPKIVQKKNVPALLAILRDTHLPARVREHAAGALGEIGQERAVGPLIDALREPRIRRGASVALGRMKAREAADALKDLASRLRAARWALSQLGVGRTVGEVIDDLRSGHLRLIPQKLRSLPECMRQQVAAEVLRQLEQVVSSGSLGPEHRWLVTALQFLGSVDAGDVLTEALRQSIHLKNCCGCVRNRLMRALGAIRPPQAIPALADVVCQVENPVHKQLAAVCIEKTVKARGSETGPLLRGQRARLLRVFNRLKRAVATTRSPTPLKGLSYAGGRPRWSAAMDRATKAIRRVLKQCERVDQAAC